MENKLKHLQLQSLKTILVDFLRLKNTLFIQAAGVSSVKSTHCFLCSAPPVLHCNEKKIEKSPLIVPLVSFDCQPISLTAATRLPPPLTDELTTVVEIRQISRLWLVSRRTDWSCRPQPWWEPGSPWRRWWSWPLGCWPPSSWPPSSPWWWCAGTATVTLTTCCTTSTPSQWPPTWGSQWSQSTSIAVTVYSWFWFLLIDSQAHGGSYQRYGDPERAVGAGAGRRGHHQPSHRSHPGERGLDRGRLVSVCGNTVKGLLTKIDQKWKKSFELVLFLKLLL